MKLGFITAIREDIRIPNEFMMKRVMSNLGPMYLAAYLEVQGKPVEVVIKDSLEEMVAYAPDLLGISSVTENIEFAKHLAAKAKRLWNPVTLLGGAHLTALPKTLPKEFDIGVVGEGEETLCELVDLFLREPRPSERSLASVAGIVFHRGGEVVQTQVRKGINDLDQIPPPNRKKYVKNTGITYMMTSRGCPYTCSFCSIPAVSEGYRKHSPSYVVQEVRYIRECFSHVRHIRIFDDLFIVDRKRVIEIAERVAAEGLHQEVNFGCWVRANLLDDSMIRAFKKMNMLYAAFGAESGSSRVVSQIKPGCTVQQNQEAVDRLYDQGIVAGFSVILGHPLETEDDLWATYEFIEKNLDKVFEVEMNVAVPWPGTELWATALQRGIVREAMDFNILKECAVLPNYSTEDYPYLNEKIPPSRFEEILDHFKKLYWKMAKRNMKGEIYKIVNPLQDIATSN